MTFTCNDLKIGGELSATGITGGLSINSTAIYVTDWSNLFGHAGISGTAFTVIGRPGAYFGGDLLGRPRFPILNIGFTRYNATGGLTLPTPQDQLWANTDQFLTFLTAPNYLEYELPDNSLRFVRAWAIDPAPIFQPRRQRTIRIPLITDNPYWKAGGTQSSDTISGADTMVVGGNAPVYDAVLTFSAAGTFTHSGLGWTIEAVGTGYPLVVNLGTRQVTQAGNIVSNRVRRNNRDWGWFTVGNNSVTSTVSVGVTWRSSFQ